jgi:probable rRNA maturation factor
MPDPGDSRPNSARSSAEPSWLSLETVDESGAWRSFGPAEDLVTAAGAALARHKRFARPGPSEACVALSDDAAVKLLNAQFRGIDKATNVLSFPPPESRHARRVPVRNIGDIVLARETVLREAAEQSLAPAHHLQHLVVHGLLHLLGFDHEAEDDANEMEALEIEILADLGIANPYPAVPEPTVPADAPAGQRMAAGAK